MKNDAVLSTGPGTGRSLTRGLLWLTLAIVLAAGAVARAQGEDAVPTALTLTNQLQTWISGAQRADYYLDNFDVQATRGPWLVTARFEADEDTIFDPQRSLGISRRAVEYRDARMTLRGGNFYATFGRGLLLRAEEDDLVRLDRDVDGIYGAAHWKALEGQALVGRPKNDDTYQRDDLIAGAEMSVQATPTLNLGAGYVRRDASADLEAYPQSHDPNLGRPVEELAGGRVRWMRGAIDAYFEGAKRFIWGEYDPVLGWTSSSEPDGRALYGSVTIGVPGYTALIEGKDYVDFDTPYSTLPPANVAGMPTNDGRDDRGFGVSLTASPSDDLTYDAAGSHAEARDEDAERSSVEAHVRKDWWGRGSLQAGGEWNEEIGMTGVTGYAYRKYAGPALNASYYLGAERSLALHSKLLGREDQIGTEPRLKYKELSVDLTFSLTPSQAITASLIRATEKLPDYDNEDTWPSLEYHWTLSAEHELKVKAGRERGGVVCSGGVCHLERPFSGVRIEFLSKL
jgi:hypothetical protein